MGCLVGLAIGETLGRPLKSLSRTEIAARYGIVRDYLSSTKSDELGLITTQTLAVAESIVATGGKVDSFDLDRRFKLLANFPVFIPDIDNSNSSIEFIAPIGLLHAYGLFERERFLHDSQIGTLFAQENSLQTQSGRVVAIAVRLLARQEILPEDLMSAALDYLPFGLLEGYPLRVKLLAAQDYLEERQTLVDNVLAGDLDIDVFRVDLNNMERCGVGSDIAGRVGAAFYAVTAYKESFEEALILAMNAGVAATALTGALAGAYHGVEAIPERWLKGLANYTIIKEVAQHLHNVARSRELTD